MILLMIRNQLNFNNLILNSQNTKNKQVNYNILKRGNNFKKKRYLNETSKKHIRIMKR